jgi:hypothetical protein
VVAFAWALTCADPAPAAAFCRANVETRPLGKCEEVEGVPLLRWMRGCVSYAFHRDFFRRVPGLGEQQIRADFDAAFAAYRDVDCGREPFEVTQLEEISGADWAEFNWDVENESLMSVRTAAEWKQLKYDPNAIALTLLYFDPDSGEIYDADMELNAGIGAFIECEDACGSGEVDLPSTLVHEAGHYLGLGHSTVVGSTMSSHADQGNLDKRTLEDDDRDGYCALELPEPDRDPDSDEVSCETPVFPQFVKVDAPSTAGSAICSVAAPGTGRYGGRSLALLALSVLLCSLRLRQRRVAIRGRCDTLATPMATRSPSLAHHPIVALSSPFALAAVLSTVTACSGSDGQDYPYAPGETRVIGSSDEDEGASSRAEQKCGDGASADVLVGSDGEVLSIVCYPNEDYAVVGADVEDDLLIEGNDVIVYGDGPESSRISGNLEIVENDAIVRGVHIAGDAILRKNNGALVDCVIEGDLLVIGDDNSLALCEIWGDVIIDGDDTVLVSNLVAGDQAVAGTNLRCNDNRRFTDIEGDGVVQDDDVLGAVNCLPAE